MVNNVEFPPSIVANPLSVEKNVVYGHLPRNVLTTLGGTMLLSELVEGSTPPQYEPRATAGFYSGRPKYHDDDILTNKTQMHPVMFVGNGGPSTPGVLHNGQIFSGSYYIKHDDDGYLPDEPQGSACDVSPYPLFEAVVHTDPVGTGIGEVLPDQDSTWALDAERDAQIATALKLGYLRFAGLEQHPLMATVSSYGVFREVGSAIDMAQHDMPIGSLTVIGGAYDRESIRYTPFAVLPYVALLPSLAVANYYYDKMSMPNGEWEVRRSPPYELFREAALFAQSEYADALEHNDFLNKPMINKLQEYTGLPYDLILRNSLRISPMLFRENRLPGRIISAVDSRLHFPNDRKIIIDPALDRWEPIYMRFIAENASKFGYPRSFLENYKGIMDTDANWRFDGRWRSENVRDGMEELLTTSPTTTILDISGIYDLMRPALWSEWFWQDMQQRTGVSCTQSIDRETNVDAHRARVDMRLLAMGHQLTRPMPDTARRVVWREIMRQIYKRV